MEQKHHIYKVIVQQRKPLATNVARKDTIAVYGRSKSKNVKVHEIQAQPAVQYQNCIPKEYTVVYFNADVHTLKNTTIKSLDNLRPESQIRPLWQSKGLASQVYCTGASCNSLPY